MVLELWYGAVSLMLISLAGIIKMRKTFVTVLLISMCIFVESGLSQENVFDKNKVYIGLLDLDSTQDVQEKLWPLAILDLSKNIYKDATQWAETDEYYFALFPEPPLNFSAFYRGNAIGSFFAQKKEDGGGCMGGDIYTGYSTISKSYYSKQVIAVYPERNVVQPIAQTKYPDLKAQVELKKTLMDFAKKQFKRKVGKMNNTRMESFSMFFTNATDTHPHIAATVTGKTSRYISTFVAAAYDFSRKRYMPLIQDIEQDKYDPVFERFLDLFDFNNDGKMEIVTFVEGWEWHTYHIYSVVHGKYKIVFKGGDEQNSGC